MKLKEKLRNIVDISVNKISSTEREAEVKLDYSELKPYFEKAYREFKAKAEIKGFRKGKAPMELIKRLYGEQIEYDALDDIISDIYRELLEKRKIDEPVGVPKLVDVDYQRGESLMFRIKYEVIPDVKITGYKGIKVEKIIHNVDDKEVEDEIQNLLNSNAKFEEVDEVTDERHRVTVDIQAVDENNLPVIGKRNEGVQIDLDDERVIEKIKERLLRARRNDEFITELQVEGNKKEKVQITVKKIEKKHLPEFNDEFVKKVTDGKIRTREEFRKYIKNELQKWYDERSELVMMDSIISELIRRNDFEVPEGLIEDFLRSMLDEEKSRYPDGKLPPDFDESYFKKQRRADAIFNAKWYIIKNKIAEIEGIKVTDEDFDKLAEKESKETGIEKDKLIPFYRQSEYIKEKLLSQKVLEFLKRNAHIRERSA